MNLKVHKLKLKRKKAWEEFISYCESTDKVCSEYKAAAYREWIDFSSAIDEKIRKENKR